MGVSRWTVVVLLAVVGSVSADTDTKAPAVEMHDASTSDAAVRQSVERRSVGDDEDLMSLVPSSRVLRNSYVRFGRSAAAGEDEQEQEAVDKRASKHYVRFGREAGRHYVRFGRSTEAGFDSSEDDGETDGGLTLDDEKRSKHYVRFGRSGGRHYVRFGRSSGQSVVDDDVEPIDEEAIFVDDLTAAANKRSRAKHYVRFGRSVDVAEPQQLKRAAKHYVRFGRGGDEGASGSTDLAADDKRAAAGKHYVRFGRSQAAGLAALADSLEKRAGKHYVRFGRNSDSSAAVETQENGDAEKRAKHYVRFGRSSGQMERLDSDPV